MRAALFTPSRLLMFVFICFLLPLRAQAAAFDGEWSVLQLCETSPEGARGYKWTYPATVRAGYFAGQYRQEGQSPSMSLKGTIKPAGSAILVAMALPVIRTTTLNLHWRRHFEVRANFTGKAGTGERLIGRVCKFTFTRAG